MLAYQNDEQIKRERKLVNVYEQWKVQARKARQELKTDISEKHLADLADSLEKGKNDLMKIYTELRLHKTPDAELRRKVDACEAVTSDIIKIVYERLTGINGEFDAEYEGQRLRELRVPDYAHSIYGSTVSGSKISQHSMSSCIAAKRADAAAELAAKEAEYKVLLEERKQKEKIRTLEEHHRKELEWQKSELERLQAERDLKAAHARLVAYNREVNQEMDRESVQPDSEIQSYVHSATQYPNLATPSPPIDVSGLAQAVQDSIALNRFPVPEPKVFNGSPIEFIEWKASFMSLIDRKGISTADKLHYLKRYVTGSAHKCLEGTFYRNDEEAYSDAWNKLNQRYGQPFVVQRAFREKLSNWPMIQSRDAEGLRNFSDFLNACRQAMPYVKGLDILNYCEENQKLMQKLPEWLASRWNRQVTISLTEGKDFPCFEEFTKFMSVEAEIACNPVTSLFALHASESFSDKRGTTILKRSKASVFNTQAVLDNDTQSDATFIEQDVSNELQVATYPVKLKLTTMMGENMILRSERATMYEVTTLQSTSNSLQLTPKTAYL
ncbi:hypothetical protein SRHO_G00308090 [Serrasalmus rhombeus]